MTRHIRGEQADRDSGMVASRSGGSLQTATITRKEGSIREALSVERLAPAFCK